MNPILKTIHASLVCSILLLTAPVRAQITPDTTLGNEASRLTPNQIINGAAADRIDGGAVRGSNLFHSFSQFNIDDGLRAYFSNPIGVQNILTRVTGNSASNILGTLGVDGTANLFLINPNGILFGKNASLDVRGSFVGTTANGVQFGNQGTFSATNPQAPALLTVNPSALLFNQLATQLPRSIENRGYLRVPDGQSVLLVGGDVRLENGEILANDGRVDLGGLTDAGIVGLTVDRNGLQLQFPETGTRSNVSLNQSVIRVDGDKGGNISIHARNLEVLNGSVILAGITNEVGSTNNQAGDITLSATDTLRIEQARILNTIGSIETGKGANLNITAGSLFVTGDSQLNTTILGKGKAGDVNINVRDRVSFDNSIIGSVVLENSQGQGGNIQISASSLDLTNEAILISSTYGDGDAGNIILNVRDRVSFNNNSNARSQVVPNAVGKGGNISISTGSLELINGSQISSATFNKGNAGDIVIEARDSVVIRNGIETDRGIVPSVVRSTVEANAEGKGGNISIWAGSLEVLNYAQLDTSTFGIGNAGSIIINTRDRVVFDSVADALSVVEQNAVGQGGDVRISTGSVQLSNNAKLNTATYGIGNAGNVVIDVRNHVVLNLRGFVYSFVAEGAVGDGGDVRISTNSLEMFMSDLNTSTYGNGIAGNIIIDARDRVALDRSRVNSFVAPGVQGTAGDIKIFTGILEAFNSTTLGTVTLGTGNAGNVIIDARERATFVDSGAFTFSRVNEKESVGKGGDIRIFTASLELLNGGQLDASTYGNGNAGNVVINATQPVTIAGINEQGHSSAIFSKTEGNLSAFGAGQGGNILITTPLLKVSDGAAIDARTSNARRGGDINLTLGTLQLLNGGQIITTTESFGRAGKITVNATDKVIISGSDPNYSDRVTKFPDRVRNIGANSGLFVSSKREGITGDIEVNSPKITLDKQALLNANSASGNGGNIKVNSDLLLLRRLSKISTNAGTEEKGGDGGNISINSKFIVAVPKEDSDITANAYQGQGGNINITTQGLFGIAASRFDTFESDITASSKLGVQGQILIEQPEVQPTQGLIELPEEVVDATRQVAQICPREPGAKPLGEFIITGRGSLPSSPLEPMTGTTTTRALATLEPVNSQKAPVSVVKNSPTSEIIEAQGWVKTSDGGIELVAVASSVSPKSTTTSSNCPVVQ